MNEAVLQNALRLRRAGKLAEAAQIYGDVLRAEPQNFEALHALGILRYQCGELEEAERLIGEATRVNPRSADALYNRGSLLLKLNRLEEALSSFERALSVKPDYPEAHGNCGNALIQLGRHAEALVHFDRLAALKPSLPEAWHNRAGALLRLKRYTEAHASYGRALALRPDYAEARKGRGTAFFKLKNFADALADADRALAFDPKNTDAWEQRADALAELNRREEAIASYDRMLALKPQSVDALYNRANNLMALRRFEDAAQGYAEVLRLQPDYHYARGSLLFCRLCCCDWSELEADNEKVVEGLRTGEPVSPPFPVLASSAGPTGAYRAARLWSDQGYPAAEPLWQGETYRHDRIRIAYLSANFHDHAVARLMAGVFEHHDKTRFEISALSFGPDGKSAMRARLMGAFERFIDVQSHGDETIARLLREAEIDIAVDLMGYTEASRPGILPFRPAPVQVNYLGYPGTLGAPYVDYIIADNVVIPEEDRAFYAEKVVHMPDNYLPADRRRAVSPRVPSRTEAGLPEKGIVFCCFNNNYKLTPAMFEIWMRLLRDVDGSVLWLSGVNDVAAHNLKREAEARGVGRERMVFASYVPRDEDHLARLRLADLFLDTLPYNAHATASDALWAGVPVVTAPGGSFPGRVAASLLRAVGMAELIAPSLAEYEEIARGLARNPAALALVKAKLARNRETYPLFDTARFTRNLESAYEFMWDRLQRGLAPESFAVKSGS